MHGDVSRRRFLGGMGTVVVVGLAGCAGPSANNTTDGENGTTGNGTVGEPTTGDETTGNETTGEETTGNETTGTDTAGGTAGGETLPGSEYPAVDEWLTETSVGAADETYDGTLLDMRGSTEVTVEVGAAGNGEFFAFAPSAVVVSPGTTVVWTWTGEGGAHNVEAEPDEQIGESDYEFSSGEPIAEAGTEFRETFDDVGVALYHCEPHLSVGMKGGVAISE
ncbi:halocyanin domain-containing protein [Halomarina rubra]|uniref:Halocyanin domain-containing protein n=1 Tax=Halomarina rubra TaxID=2071873 RepID=A0ABD6AW90_9EURY|nr:halocyanin domain-containing protein [Halomarina rubra]